MNTSEEVYFNELGVVDLYHKPSIKPRYIIIIEIYSPTHSDLGPHALMTVVPQARKHIIADAAAVLRMLKRAMSEELREEKN